MTIKRLDPLEESNQKKNVSAEPSPKFCNRKCWRHCLKQQTSNQSRMRNNNMALSLDINYSKDSIYSRGKNRRKKIYVHLVWIFLKPIQNGKSLVRFLVLITQKKSSPCFLQNIRRLCGPPLTMGLWIPIGFS